MAERKWRAVLSSPHLAENNCRARLSVTEESAGRGYGPEPGIDFFGGMQQSKWL
jgi:hypothetical protein